jgi:hypothetical protein
MTMIMVNIQEAKAKLSEFVDAVERGERVLICKPSMRTSKSDSVTLRHGSCPLNASHTES